MEGFASNSALPDEQIVLQKRLAAQERYIYQLEQRNQQLVAQLQELQAQKNLQTSILNSLEAGIWSASADSCQILYVNAATEQLYHRPVAELWAQPQIWIEAIHPDDRAWVVAAQSTLANTGSLDLEYRICLPDGTIRWIRDRRWLIQEAEQPQRMDGLLLDITDHRLEKQRRKQIETMLRRQTEQERLLGAIARRVRQSLKLTTILNTTVLEVRQFLQTDRVLIYRFAADWSGYVIVESVAAPWTAVLGNQYYDPCFHERYLKKYRDGYVSRIDDIHTANLSPCHVELLKQIQVRANLVVPIQAGEQLWGLLIAHHCRSDRQWDELDIELLQQLATQVGIAIQQANLFEQVQHLNIHLEEQVEARTQELQQSLQFGDLLKRITDGVRDSLDESQILQTVVQELAVGLDLEFCDNTCYDMEQQTSTVRFECVRHGPAALGCIWKMAEFPEFYAQLLDHQCFQFCNEHAIRGWLAILACPVFDDRGVLGDLWLARHKRQVFSDAEIRLVQQVVNQCAIAIRQARLYQAAQQQVRELERLNALKDDFLSTVSHELRTPVASIKMASQMLEVCLLEAGLLNSEESPLSRYLGVLQDECDREISLVNDLLDLSRLEADAVPLCPISIPLQAWIPHLVEPFLPRLQTQQQQLKIDIPNDLPAIVTDLAMLERVFVELLHNACKYTPLGGHICLTVMPNLEGVQITIGNSGVEISLEERSRVFDKFYRVPNSDPWKHGGTGLGLALAKKLIEQLQGTIGLGDRSGWTTFIMWLPQTLLISDKPAFRL